MESAIFNVSGISCSHCEKAIKGAVGKLSGVKEVNVGIEEKTVAVKFDKNKVSFEQILSAIEDQGYDDITRI